MGINNKSGKGVQQTPDYLLWERKLIQFLLAVLVFEFGFCCAIMLPDVPVFEGLVFFVMAAGAGAMFMFVLIGEHISGGDLDGRSA